MHLVWVNNRYNYQIQIHCYNMEKNVLLTFDNKKKVELCFSEFKSSKIEGTRRKVGDKEDELE